MLSMESANVACEICHPRRLPKRLATQVQKGRPGRVITKIEPSRIEFCNSGESSCPNIRIGTRIFKTSFAQNGIEAVSKLTINSFCKLAIRNQRNERLRKVAASAGNSGGCFSCWGAGFSRLAHSENPQAGG